MGDIETIVNDAEKKASNVSDNIDSISGPEITKDKAGDTFDPEQHAKDKDGNPVITAAGYFRKKSGPRKPKKQDQVQEQPELNLEGLNAGAVAAEISFMVGQGFFGPDGKPTPEERETLIPICDLALQDRGIERLSPAWLYVAFMAGYSANRITKPQVQSRISALWSKAKTGAKKAYKFFKGVFSK